MSSGVLLVKNGTVVPLGAGRAVPERADVLVEGSVIRAVGRHLAAPHGARELDARGGLVLPGLLNAHHHTYSTLARGLTPPGEPARTFKEILERLWWRLDCALSTEDVHASALLAAMDAAQAGCTTIVDHHASPACADGSLDAIEDAFRAVGINGCLCYEVSDRNAEGEGIAENERYIRKCAGRDDPQFAALFGLHASMTLGARTMERCAGLIEDLDAGVHVHVAEAPCDGEVTRDQFGMKVMERFAHYGMTGPGSLFAHGIHLDAEELAIIHATGSMMVTNPESNMHNGLAATPVLDILARGIPLGLGTDGMSNALIAQARAANLVQRATHRDPRIAFGEACAMLLEHNRTICNRLFREPRGEIAPGRLADLAIFDYTPFTPLNAATLGGHLLFGLAHARVRHTVCRGRVIVEDGRLPHLDEAGIRARAASLAQQLWGRL